MVHSNFILALISLCFLADVHSYKLKLENRDDQGTGSWAAISCRYTENFEEYSDMDPCSDKIVLNPLKESIFQGTVSGTWGICSQRTCELVFYDNRLPSPKSIKVKSLVSGQSLITIGGKKSLLGDTLTSLGEIKPAQPWGPIEKWEEPEFLITAPNIYVLVFTISVPRDTTDYALIDSIELDYGDDVTPPPEPATEAPPIPVFSYELDTLGDVSSEFDISCNYVDHISEYWMWGCDKGADVSAEQPWNALGFWSPCQKPYCHIQFNAGEERPRITSVQLNGTFTPGTVVTVSKKNFGPLDFVYREVGRYEVEDDESSVLVDLDPLYCKPGIYNISISIENGGLALIDQIFVELEEDDDVFPCTEPTRAPPIKPTTEKDDGADETTATTEPSDGSKDTTPGAGTRAATVSILSAALILFCAFGIY